MKTPTVAVALILVGLLGGCLDARAPAPPGVRNNSEQATHTVRLVFIDCYEPVQLSVNGVEVVNRRFETLPETGLSGIINAELTPRSAFHLATGDLSFDQVVEVNAATRIVYINPRHAPHIVTSTSDVVLLD